MHCAPIALFAYNRPEHLRRTVDSLRANPLAKDSVLYLFCDAARTADHANAVMAVRSYVHSIDGFHDVRIVEREKNLGLSSSIHQGVASLCDVHGQVIVLEDDLNLAPSFLEFMNASLAHYARVDSVMQVSGYQFPGVYGEGSQAVMLPIISCWGWATWARAWRHYDHQGKGAELLDQDQMLRKRFNLGGAYDYYGMLQDQRAGRIDSWGVRWLLSVFLREGLVLYPPTTLVQNIGVDGSGTHGGGVQDLQSNLGDIKSFTWSYPEQIEIDGTAFDQVKRLLYAQRPSVFKRILRKLGV